MKPEKLPIRTALACSNLWKIEKSERDLLDRFFILWDSGAQFLKDIRKREAPRYPYESEYFLQLEEEATIWNIKFLKPIAVIEKLQDNQLALSFREHKQSNFHWLVVTEWKDREREKEQKNDEADTDTDTDTYVEVHPKELSDG